jgi:hypothetical protein
MKTFPCAIVLVALVASAGSSLAGEMPKPASAPVPAFRERGSIPGIDLKAIRAALPVFEQHGLKIDGYKVSVIEDGDFVVVLFDDPQRPPGQMGNSPRMSSFEVRLKRSDLRVVRSNFVR